ncbi:MAG TPA: NAD(P)H-hydrate dehydratase [Streptosporangiaceae bacterium]|nr:NAD(P)H-hydrate dehydratase [Streptosporangiaceae bacterium]
MRNAHAVAGVRAAEGALMALLPDGALMQRAAAGLASACARLLRLADGVYGARVVVLVGSGDNGGDALYAGARLAARGAVVTAIAAASRAHQGGLAALRESGGRLIEAAGTDPAPAAQAAEAGAGQGPDVGAAQAAVEAIADADLIIDGLLGIGGRGGLREPAASLAAAAGRSGALVVAVDLPSGIEADTGEVAGAAVQADVTITFGTLKPGLLIDPGASCAGVVERIDIGLDPYLGGPDVAAPQSADIAAWLPRPSAESDKYRRGVLGVVAGSDRFTGAAPLAVGGAIRGGAGMVRLVSAPAAAAVVRQYWPEAVITTTGDGRPGDAVIAGAGQVQAWVAGPGMGTDEAAVSLLAAVLATDLPVLVDADGITMLAAHRRLLERSAPTLLTPHAGELARLLGAERPDVEAHRLRFATRAAAELGCTVLLKGSTTVIAPPGPGQEVLVNPTGTSWLATAGSGDVLSGLAGSLLAQGLDPLRAAGAAAYLHGMAARLAADGAPIGSTDIITALPAAIRAVAGG